MRKVPTCTRIIAPTDGFNTVRFWFLTLILLSLATSLMADEEHSPCPECPECRNPAPRTRPYFRSALARSVYSKIQADEAFAHFNREEWYNVRLDVLDQEVRDLFIQLDRDDEDTEKFLDQCKEGSEAVFTQLFHLVARTFLGPFLSQTSVNGLLRRGSMFVLSAQQFQRLFRLPDDYRAEALLDLGAGDGATTALLAPMFSRVHATEVSWPMKRILSARGFVIEDVDGWTANSYDVICALNLLDRCSKPLTLLDQMKSALKPGGRILLALVWPFRPYVESNADHRPEEELLIQGQSFEDQVTSLIRSVLIPRGFKVLGWSKVPYLCEGDLEKTFYHLSDILVALQTE